MSSNERSSQPHQRSGARRAASLPTGEANLSFDQLVRLAARLLGAPVGFLSFVEEDQIRISSSHGTSGLIPKDTLLAGRDTLFHHVIDGNTTVALPDTALADLAENCWMSSQTGIRSFLGVPLRLSKGETVAVLSVADFVPRYWTDDDLEALEDYAGVVCAEIHRRQGDAPSQYQRGPVPQTPRHADRLIELIGEGVYAVDTSGVCHFINRAGANILGYEPEQVLGQRMHELVHHSYPDGTPMPREECTIVTAMLTGDPHTVSDHVFWRADGTPVRVELTASPVTGNGVVTGTVVRFSDLLEHKRQQEQLRESELRKRAMFEAALDSIITVDHEGRIVEFNAAAERTFGYTREYAIGRMMADLITPPDQREPSLHGFSNDLETGKASVLGNRVEREVMRADGTLFHTEMAVTRIDLPGRPDPLFTAYLRDISDQKEAEAEIRRFMHMVDAVGQAVIANDNSPERRITYWNKAAEEILGLTAEEALGRKFYDVVPARDFHDDVRRIGVRVRRGESWQGEFQMRHKDGAVIPALATVSPILDDDGQLLGVVSAYTDLTAIKEAEQEIRLYKHIVDAVGESVVASDMDRKIFYANRAAEEALGWTIDEVRGLDVRDVVPEESYREESSRIGKEVRESGDRLSGEFVLRRTNGETFPALVTLNPIAGDGEELVGTIGIYTDISELKATEEDLRFHKHAFDAVGQAVVAADQDRNITYWNNAAEALLGWSRADVLGRPFLETVPAECFADEAGRIGQQVRDGRVWDGEYYLRHRDGTTIHALSSVRAVVGEQGELIGVITAHSDLRELNEAEQEIRFFKHIVDAIGEAVVATSLEGRITYLNSAAERMLGWDAADLIGRALVDTIPDQSRIEDAREISAFVRAGKPWFSEFSLQRKDGSTFPALISIAPVVDETGETAGIISVYSEISDLKAAERENRFFKHVVDAVGQVVIANDLDRNITYWNQTAEEILGWKAEEVLGVDAATIAPMPEFLPEIPSIAAVVRSGSVWTGEFPLQRRDGSEVPALSALSPIFDEDGEIIGILGAHTDIRELKRTEQDLRFHKHIVEAVAQGVVVSDNQGVITYWNKAAEEIYGWTADEAIGREVFKTLPATVSEEEDRAAEVTRRVASGETWAGEAQVRHKNGTEFPAYFTVAPIRDAAGEIVGIIGVSHDISDQKENERQIEFHKIMLDAVGQTIVTTDTNGVITYWSKGAEQALGWTAEEVLGLPIADIAPADHLKEEAGELQRAVREGKPWTGEFPIRRKDGSTFPAVVSLAPVTLADQGTVGVIGVYTDITELKQTEDELRLHKHMLDAVGQAVCATDENLRVTYWNRSAEELYGYAASDAIGKKLVDFFPAQRQGREDAFKVIEAVTQYGDWSGEMSTCHRDGSEISALVSISPVLGEGGRQVGLIVAMADITARRRIEEALKESSEQISEILETMGDGFISISRDWNIQHVNRQAERILNRKRADLLGKNFWEEFPESEEMPFYKKFVEAFETGKPIGITEYDPYLDMWLEVHASPSGDRLSLFFRDVTERRSREVALREAEERYRTLVEQLPAMTYIAEADDLDNLTYVGPQLEQMLGYTPEWWLSSSSSWSDLIHPDDLDYVTENDTRTIRENRGNFTLEYRLQASDGSYHWLRDTATLIRDIDGNPMYWQGLSYDITEQKRIERAVQENEQRFRSLFENHPEAVFSIDRTGRVLSANPAFQELTGHPASQAGTLQFVDLVVPDDQDRVRERFAETHQGDPQDFRTGIYDARGIRTELNLTTIPIVVDDEIVGVHIVAQDVTIHQELENQLAHQAYHDSLTGLPNRNLFQNRLDQRLEDAWENDDQFAVLFFDLDDFKVINDSLGHSAGDQLLIEVAQRVQTCIRSGDLLARLGGDEFTLLLADVIDQEDAIVIAERIASVLDEPFMVDEHEVFATTSIGIALGYPSSPSSDDILRNADLAMYEAKNSGKDRYAIFEPSMNSRAWLRLTLEAEIRRGIPRNEFRVFYQPIVDLTTGELEGVEALVRWEHPERGFLTPKDFISVAEQSGLILPLGRWIIREATRQIREWQRLSPDIRPLRLSLNLSPKQYQHPKLIEELTRSLDNVEFDPYLITLEITENLAMDDSAATLETLQQLKGIGVQLALDDFGTGFSALSYLRRFPIDIIKIDQSFVDGLGNDPEDTTIVRAVMAASLAMQMKVTAEGIETVDQLNMLRDLGCHLGQGYLFSRPMAADEMRQVVATKRTVWKSLIIDAESSDSSRG